MDKEGGAGNDYGWCFGMCGGWAIVLGGVAVGAVGVAAVGTAAVAGAAVVGAGAVLTAGAAVGGLMTISFIFNEIKKEHRKKEKERKIEHLLAGLYTTRNMSHILETNHLREALLGPCRNEMMKSDVLLNIIIRDSGRIKDKKLGSVGNLKIL